MMHLTGLARELSSGSSIAGRQWAMLSARRRAEAAVALADRELSGALPRLADEAAALATADAASRSLVHRAWGHALLHGGRADRAVVELRAAARFAVQACDPSLEASARTKLAFALHLAGRLKAALHQVNLAVTGGPDEVDRVRALGTRALILRESGAFGDALADLNTAVRVLRRLDDQLGLQRVLINRGILRVDTGDHAGALTDLTEAERLARLLERPAAVALIASNLGYAASRAGDVPRALAEYDRAEVMFRANHLQLCGLLMDRAELLTRTGLDDEAFAVAQVALSAARDEGRPLRVPEARLLVAQAAGTLGRHVAARDQARRARTTFESQGRTTWAAAAALAVAQASVALGGHPRRGSLQDHAEVLATAGWRAEAVEAFLLLARLSGGATRAAALRRAVRVAGRGPVLVRARAWYARALLATDPGAARALVRRGLRQLDEHLAGVGADELRAGLARHRQDLAGLGVDLALARRSPAAVFGAVEQARATVVVPDLVRPPSDPHLVSLLNRRGSAGSARERAALAMAVRDRSRIVRGSMRLLQPVRAPALDAALREAGHAALVVWFFRSGRLHALTRVAGRTRLTDLADESLVRSCTDRTSFAAHRLSSADGSEARDGAARALLAGAVALLSSALLGRLTEVAERPLVLVPPAALHALPFAELPAVAGRSVSVSASVRQWLFARQTVSIEPDGARVLVVAGPGLPGARAEAEAIAAGHGVRALVGAAASVHSVLEGLAGADLAHLATHGWLRPDNPQFSELTLADGAMLVHHLDTVGRLPRVLVLASCDSGRPVTRPGEALLGFAAACLARGTRSLIAPVAPVPDGETGALMVGLHERLRAGVAPADALAQLQAGQPAGRRVFVCFGAG